MAGIVNVSYAQFRRADASLSDQQRHEQEMEECNYRFLDALRTGRSSRSDLFWRREYQGGKTCVEHWQPKESLVNFTDRDPCPCCGTRKDMHGETCR